MAVFVAFEGVEGSGKTTQARLLHDRMTAEGRRVVLAREPGVTALGNYLRAWLKQYPAAPRAELFLFCAARSQLVAEVVSPALAEGVDVVTDRYSGSTIAYQGYGRDLGEQVVRPVIDLATEGVEPDLYVLLDIDPVVALRRIATGGRGTTADIQETPAPSPRIDEEGQRFEEEPLEFHQRVRGGYLSLAAASPETWLVLDAARPVAETAELIWQRVAALLGGVSEVS